LMEGAQDLFPPPAPLLECFVFFSRLAYFAIIFLEGEDGIIETPPSEKKSATPFTITPRSVKFLVFQRLRLARGDENRG